MLKEGVSLFIILIHLGCPSDLTQRDGRGIRAGNEIAKLHNEMGITVILVSHSMEDVAKYVERIIVMNKGSVLYDNAPKEVFKHYKELEAVGLAAPQVTYIMQALKERGLPVNTEVTTIMEARDEILRVKGVKL